MVRKSSVAELTAGQLAQKMRLNFSELQEFAKELGLTISSATETIDAEIAERFLSIGQKKSTPIVTPPPSQDNQPYTEPVTAQDLANRLGIQFSELAEILSGMKISASKSSTLIQPEAANSLLLVGDGIKSTSRKLGGSSEVNTENVIADDNEEALSLLQVKHLAQIGKVTQTTVLHLHQALRRKAEEIALQQGYYEQKRELAIADTGRTLAMMEHYHLQTQQLRDKEAELNAQNFDTVAIAKELGIDIEDIFENQKYRDEEYLKNKVLSEQKAEEIHETEKWEIENNQFPNSLRLMQLSLQELGKQLKNEQVI